MKFGVKHMAVFAVGGGRNLSEMEEAIFNGQTDFIFMCRPFIRSLIGSNGFGKVTQMASCKNFNKWPSSATQ
jgi:hypothetical protein